MNKRGIKLKYSIITILMVLAFIAVLLIFPVNPEDISGNLVKADIIKTIEPTSNSKISENSVKIIVTTEKSALCKSSKMKSGGYYPAYVNFQRTNAYYHETIVSLDKGRNNFKIYCRQLDIKDNTLMGTYDYNYWSIKKI